jgi:hypothetical protein
MGPHSRARPSTQEHQKIRRLPTCSKVFGDARLVGEENIYSVSVENYAISDSTQDWQFSASPNLGCLTLSEVHRWKKDGSFTGAVTRFETVELAAEVDQRRFHIADNYREAKPSECRQAMAAFNNQSDSGRQRQADSSRARNRAGSPMPRWQSQAKISARESGSQAGEKLLQAPSVTGVGFPVLRF